MQIKKSQKAAALLLAVAFSSFGVTQSTQAAPAARVHLDGQPLATSVPPMLKGGRTLVPMRDIFEALGATVVWDSATREIRAQKGDQRIWLQIANRMARVDGQERWLEEAPLIYMRSTLVPLRFVSESLGADVTWNGAERLVSIITNDRIVANPVDIDNEGDMTDVRASMTIPSGAVVPVTLDQTLSSATARVGDSFTATVKSERLGDSEFPTGTKLRGRISEVRTRADGVPGVLGLEFHQAVLPDGRTIAVSGDLISLDDDSVTNVSDGRIMAKSGDGKTDLKIVGIGAAAGYVLGKVLNKNELITGILGAAGGYLYDRSRDKGKEQEAVVNAGTTLGVRLTQSVTYADANYYDQRAPYLN